MQTLISLGLTVPERIALGTRLLEIITPDQAVHQLLYHATYTLECLDRGKRESPFPCLNEKEIILAAVASARAVLPALLMQHSKALVHRSMTVDDEEDARRRHTENPKVFASYEKRLEYCDRMIEMAVENIGKAEAVLARGMPEAVSVAAAALGAGKGV